MLLPGTRTPTFGVVPTGRPLRITFARGTERSVSRPCVPSPNLPVLEERFLGRARFFFFFDFLLPGVRLRATPRRRSISITSRGCPASTSISVVRARSWVNARRVATI